MDYELLTGAELMRWRCQIMRSQIFEDVHTRALADVLARKGFPGFTSKQVCKRLKEFHKMWERVEELKKLPGAKYTKGFFCEGTISIPQSQYNKHIRAHPEDVGLLNCEIPNFGHVDRYWRDPFVNRRNLTKTTFEEPVRKFVKKDVLSSKDKGKGACSSSKKALTECSSSDEDFSKLFCFKAPTEGIKTASDSEDDFM